MLFPGPNALPQTPQPPPPQPQQPPTQAPQAPQPQAPHPPPPMQQQPTPPVPGPYEEDHSRSPYMQMYPYPYPYPGQVSCTRPSGNDADWHVASNAAHDAGPACFGPARVHATCVHAADAVPASATSDGEPGWVRCLFIGLILTTMYGVAMYGGPMPGMPHMYMPPPGAYPPGAAPRGSMPPPHGYYHQSPQRELRCLAMGLVVDLEIWIVGHAVPYPMMMQGPPGAPTPHPYDPQGPPNGPPGPLGVGH